MGETLTSEFISSDVGSTEVRRDEGGNFEAPRSEIQVGDPEKLINNDSRQSAIITYDLGNPSVGLAIPKSAIITKVTYTLTPSFTSLDDATANDRWSMAHAASDGYWDRGNLHPLSVNVSGVQYGPPGFSSCVTDVTGYNSDLDLIATTNVQNTDPARAASTTGFFNLGEYMTIGSTFQLFLANESLKYLNICMNQRFSNPSPLSNVEMHIKVFECHKNGRQFSVGEHIGTSDSKGYNDLTKQNTSTSTLCHTIETWTFSPAIQVYPTTQWLAFVLEGDWFHPDYIANYKIAFNTRKEQSQTSGNQPMEYMPGSNGSQIWASSKPASQNYNALQDYYEYTVDLPFVYPPIDTTPVTSPYQRYFGTIMQLDGTEGDGQIKTWTLDTPHYLQSGPDVSGNNGISAFGDAPVTNMQAWIDSDDYDPVTEKTWTGLILGIQDLDNHSWLLHGPGAVESKRPKLTIEYELPPATIVDDTLDANFPLSLIHVDLPATDQVAIIWTFSLTNDTLDVLHVPGLHTLDSITSLTEGIDLSAGAMTGGQHFVEITGAGVETGKQVTIVSLHRVGHRNHLTIDDNPT